MAMTPDQVRAAMAAVMARAKAEPIPQGMPVRPADPKFAGANFKLDTSAATRKKIDDAIKSGKVPPRAMPQMPEGMGIPEPQGTRPRPDDFKAVGSPVRTDADKAKAAATLADFIKNGGTLKDVMPKMDDDPLTAVPAPNLSAADKAKAAATLAAAIKAGGIAPKAMPYIPGGEMPPGVVAGNGSNPATPGLLESIANAAGGGNYTIPVPGLANGGTPPAAPPAIPASPNFVNGIEDYWKLSNDARQQAVKDFTNWAPGQMPQNQIMNWTDWLGAATNPTQMTAPTSTKLSQEQFNLLSRDEQMKLLNPGHLFESALNQDGAAGQYMWGGPQAGYEYVVHDYSGYGAGLKEYGKQTNHADKYGDKVAGQFSAELLNSISDASKYGDERAQFIQRNLKAYMDNPGMFDNMGMGSGNRATNTSDPISRISAAYDQQQAFHKLQAEREAAIATNKAQKKAEREAEAASRTARQAPKPVLEEEPEMNAFASGTLPPRRGREMGRKVSRSREPMPPALPAPQSNGVIPRPNGTPIGGQVSPPSGPMPRPTPDNTSTWPSPNQYPPLPTGGVVDGGWHRPRPNGIPLPIPSPPVGNSGTPVYTGAPMPQRPQPPGPPSPGKKWAMGDNGQWDQIPEGWEMTWGGPRPMGGGQHMGTPPTLPTGGVTNNIWDGPKPMPTNPDGSPKYPTDMALRPGDYWKWNPVGKWDVVPWNNGGATPPQMSAEEWRREKMQGQPPRPTGPQRGGSDLPDLYWENQEEYFRQKGNPAPGPAQPPSNESQYASQPWFNDWKAAGGTGDPLAWAQANRHWMLGPNGQSPSEQPQVRLGTPPQIPGGAGSGQGNFRNLRYR